MATVDEIVAGIETECDLEQYALRQDGVAVATPLLEITTSVEGLFFRVFAEITEAYGVDVDDVDVSVRKLKNVGDFVRLMDATLTKAGCH